MASAGLALLLRREQVGTLPFLAEDPIIDAIDAFQDQPVRNLVTAGGELDLEQLATLGAELVVGLAGQGLPVTAIRKLVACRTVSRTGQFRVDVEALRVAMGAPYQVERKIDEFGGRCDRLARWVDARTMPSISVLSPGLDGSSLHILGGPTPAGHVLNGLQITRPVAQRMVMSQPIAFREISLERVDEHDADVILMLAGPTADPRFLHTQPVWNNLRAVRSGDVIMVDALRWASVASLIDAEWVLDDLDAILRKSTAPPIGIATPTGLARIDRYREFS